MDKKPGGFQQQTIDRENMETNKKTHQLKSEELIHFLLLGENRVSKYFSVILMQRQLQSNYFVGEVIMKLFRFTVELTNTLQHSYHTLLYTYLYAS